MKKLISFIMYQSPAFSSKFMICGLRRSRK